MDIEDKINKMAALKVISISETAKTQLMEPSFTKACRTLTHMQAIILYEIKLEKNIKQALIKETYNDVMLTFYADEKLLQELMPKDIFKVFLI